MLEDQDMSAQEAAAIVQDARTRARRELVINMPVVYLAGGLVLLIGYGALWLSVRGQHPYRAPSGGAIATVFVLAAFAVAAVLITANRATAGVGGRSARHRLVLLTTWGSGYLILLILQVAISGSVSARTLAVVDFAAPLLLAGVVYLLGAALGRNRLGCALGAWLVIVAVSCAWLVPSVILATGAVAGGGAFLLAALIETRLRARAR